MPVAFTQEDFLVLSVFLFSDVLLFRRLLVGAPRAQTGQRKIIRGGAVYRCRIDRPGTCRQIPFDTNGKYSQVMPTVEPLSFYERSLGLGNCPIEFFQRRSQLSSNCLIVNV